MPEHVSRLVLRACPVPDMQSFAVDHITIHWLGRRKSLFAGWEGNRQPATWLCGTRQYVGHGPAHFLAAEPGEEDGVNLVTPGQEDRGAGVDHHDCLCAYGSHCSHQLVLAAGQSE